MRLIPNLLTNVYFQKKYSLKFIILLLLPLAKLFPLDYTIKSEYSFDLINWGELSTENYSTAYVNPLETKFYLVFDPIEGNTLSLWVREAGALEWDSNLFQISIDGSSNPQQFFRTQIEENIQPNILNSGTISHTQTWSQETNYDRTGIVRVPRSLYGPFPVLILLHGASGNASNYINRYSSFSNYIRVALQGYDPPPSGSANGNSGWNIRSEGTKADDIDFLLNIINQLKSYDNVDSSNITLIGSSNGGGLVNKATIELPIDTFKNSISLASQLFEDVYHDNSFWYNPNGIGNYNATITPDQGRRILSIHATGDTTIPYDGGQTWLNNGGFYPAQESIYILAEAMGYQGDQLLSDAGENTNTPSGFTKYSYLNGQVIHYKVEGSNHGLSNVRNFIDTVIRDFIE